MLRTLEIQQQLQATFDSIKLIVRRTPFPKGSLRGGAVWTFPEGIPLGRGGLEMLLKYNFDSQCVTSVIKFCL